MNQSKGPDALDYSGLVVPSWTDLEADGEAEDSYVLKLFEKHFERNIGSGRFLDVAAEEPPLASETQWHPAKDSLKVTDDLSVFFPVPRQPPTPANVA